MSISSERRTELLRLYQHLPRFDDVIPALHSLKTSFRLFAFSNGKRSEINAVLSNASILDYFEGLVTADDVRSFKPNPAVYSYARRVTKAWSSPFWLVSSNPWDVIGARSAGLSSACVQRSEEKIYDPWGVEPNVTVRSLIDLPEWRVPNPEVHLCSKPKYLTRNMKIPESFGRGETASTIFLSLALLFLKCGCDRLGFQPCTRN